MFYENVSRMRKSITHPRPDHHWFVFSSVGNTPDGCDRRQDKHSLGFGGRAGVFELIHLPFRPFCTGGRQIDGSISSLVALERIRKSQKVREAQASGKLTLLFDSGIRTGSDIFRALALGAQGVLCECTVLLLCVLGGTQG